MRIQVSSKIVNSLLGPGAYDFNKDKNIKLLDDKNNNVFVTKVNSYPSK